MTKFLVLPLALTAALGLAACSPKAQNETAQAADTIAADANATMSEAAADASAAADRALGARRGIDRQCGCCDRERDRCKALDKTGNAMKAAGSEIED